MTTIVAAWASVVAAALANAGVWLPPWGSVGIAEEHKKGHGQSVPALCSYYKQ